jgi:ribosome-associated toxin RatA of RatAB toxin-antitoxin module
LPEVSNSAEIHAPADRVFDFIAQAERNAEWVPDVLQSERLTPGPTQVGTRFRFVSRIAGIPIDITDEVTAFQPGRLIAFSGVSGPPHAGSWHFEPITVPGGQERTRVTYRMAFELPPGIGPFVAKMLDIPRRMDEQSRICLANLRRLLER